MATKTIPDGAGITNHYTAAFAPWVNEANFTKIGALKDEIEVVDGPDKRGYVTGQPSKQEVQLTIPSHDPAAKLMHTWKDACENGLPLHNATGVITISTAADVPVEIWEITNCICRAAETKEMGLDGADVSETMFMVSYSRAKRIGP
jgi:hypothetical protein